MSHPAILDRGSHESTKAALHMMALGLGVVMGTYNLAAWLIRRQPHFLINACVYSVLCFWEVQHIAEHLQKMDE